MLLPVITSAETYNYGKVISLSKGSDNFGFDLVKKQDNAGIISMEGDYVNIDGKKYELNTQEAPNLYKSKNCSLEFVYKSGVLAMVKLFKSNKVVCYVISQDQSLAANK